MKIKNECARLIDFSFDSKKYRLMPAGKSVEVPEGAMKSTFLKTLIDNGSLSVVTKDEPKETKSKK